MRTILVYTISLAGLFIFCNTVNCQEISKYDLEQRASSHFSNHRYLKAVSDYEILHRMFPKDTKYAYFLGRSYLNANKELEHAAELLKFAATRNYGDDTYFYLGQVYHNSYKFEDATLAFITFKKTCSERKRKKYDVDYWITVTRNARQSATVSHKIYVENLKSVPANAIEAAFQGDYSGKFVYVPDELKSAQDKASNSKPIMFLPDKIKKGDYLYYASRSKNNRQGEDIYRVKYLNEKEFSMPERLPDAVNTNYDDGYPFYDQVNGWLYFSSKGHNTSGGYDIFRIKYDHLKDEWVQPEKLNFPVNSVRDDFQFVLSADQKTFTFLTNRNSLYSECDAFTVQYPLPGEFITIQNRDEAMTFALLTPASITLDFKEGQGNETGNNQEVVLTTEISEEPLPVNYEPISEDYASLIEQALDMQEQADSLHSAIQLLKKDAEGETDYRKKQDIKATIFTLEKEYARLQKLTNDKFAQAEKTRKPEYNGTILVIPNNIAKEETNITVHRFSNSELPDAAIAAADQERKGADVKRAVADISSGFSILNSSPYSDANPIPYTSSTAGLIYRIQLGSFTSEIPSGKFGGLTPVFKENSVNGMKYYVGSFRSITDARAALDKVKAYGFADAFLISFYNDRKISIQEAREIEFAGKY